MQIFLGSDHAGFEMKAKVKVFLESKGHIVTDCGPEVFDPMDDYPDFISRVAENVSKNLEAKGIVFGKTGEGEDMVANRFPNVRSVVYYGGPKDIIILSRKHNDANILSLGAEFIDKEKVNNIIELWLNTPFSGDERHIRRIKEIEDYSK